MAGYGLWLGHGYDYGGDGDGGVAMACRLTVHMVTVGNNPSFTRRF
jgi:hypothetical protein